MDDVLDDIDEGLEQARAGLQQALAKAVTGSDTSDQLEEALTLVKQTKQIVTDVRSGIEP